MFSNKIILLALFVALPASQHAWAADPQPDRQILIDRAHYWERLGRVDMAYEVWQALLLIEPDNKEALAEVAKYKASTASQSETGVVPATAVPEVSTPANTSEAKVPAVSETAKAEEAPAPEAAKIAAVPVPEAAAAPGVVAETGKTVEASVPQRAVPEAMPSGAIAAPEAGAVVEAPLVMEATQKASVQQAGTAEIASAVMPEVQSPIAVSSDMTSGTSPAVPSETGTVVETALAPETVSEIPVSQATTAEATPAATQEATPTAPEASVPEAPAPAVSEAAKAEEAPAPQAAVAETLPAVAPVATQIAGSTPVQPPEAVPATPEPVQTVAPEAAAVIEVPLVSEAANAAAPEASPKPELQPAPAAEVVPASPETASAAAQETTPGAQETVVPEAPASPEVLAPAVAETLPAVTPVATQTAASTPVQPPEAVPAATMPEPVQTAAPEAAAVIEVPLVSETANAAAPEAPPKPELQPAPAAEVVAVAPETAPAAVQETTPGVQETVVPEAPAAPEVPAPAVSEAAKAEEAPAPQATVAETVPAVTPVATQTAASTPVQPPEAVPATPEPVQTAAPEAAAVIEVPLVSETANAAAPEASPKPELQPAPVAEAAPETVSVSPVLTQAPEPVFAVTPVQPENKTILVEDWADLYGDNAGLQPGSAYAGPGADMVSNEPQGAVSEQASADDRASHSMLAEPAVSAAIENPGQPVVEKSAPVVAEQAAIGAPAPVPALAPAPVPVPVSAPASPAALTSVPASVAVSAPESPPVVADSREKNVRPGLGGAVPPALKVLSSRDGVPDVAQSEPKSGPGGAILVNQQPSKQELLDRAAYWDSRGRGDLAAKYRSQLRQPVVASASPARAIKEDGRVMEPVHAIASQPMQAVGMSATPGSAQGKPSDGSGETAGSFQSKPLDRAAYWDSHGRGDPADKTHNQLRPAGAQVADNSSSTILSSGRTVPVMATRGSEANTGMQSGTAQPSRQELSEKADYWESRGRGDLAAQIRQKLQTMEGRPGASERRGQDTGVRTENFREGIRESAADRATRSALEDSLLKNPNSMKTRLDLARIYRAAGELPKARLQIDSVLADSPDLPEALFASAQLYADQRLWWESLNTLEKISPVARTGEMARLQKTGWAHMQIDRAEALVRQGRNQDAELLLREVAMELAVNDNQVALPEPPPLWKSAGQVARKREQSRKGKR